jgi:hypothetical protein
MFFFQEGQLRGSFGSSDGWGTKIVYRTNQQTFWTKARGQCYLSVVGHFVLIEVSARFFGIGVDHQKNFSISSLDLSFALLIGEFMLPRRGRRSFLYIC